MQSSLRASAITPRNWLDWLVLVALVIAGLVVVRNAFVRDAIFRGAATAPLGSDDPKIAATAATSNFGRLAQRGLSPSAEQVRDATAIGQRAPLLPEPFLIAGVAADQAGNMAAATEMYEAALSRAPRSPAVRYLLADHYRRLGRTADALDQLVVLMKVQNAKSLNVAPYFASLVHDPVGEALLIRLAGTDPAFARQLLAMVAHQLPPATVLRISRKLPPSPEDKPWQSNLLQSLVARSEFEAAADLWSGFSKRRLDRFGLNDLQFVDRTAPGPFGWTYSSGADGVAEPVTSGKLQLLYFGRNPTVLASQLGLLRPGKYRLDWQADELATMSIAINWRMICLPANSLLDGPTLAERAWIFAIPDGCTAQRFELFATPSHSSARANITLSSLSLARVP